MKLVILMLVYVLVVPVVASADISMIAIQAQNGGEYVIWHPDGIVSLYVHQTVDGVQKLVKVKSLDPADYPLENKINPVDGVSGHENEK